ncbi:phage antirepressor N-terminal domain-containing protein [Methylobacterium phyllosphaerae]|uniref:phage antirepressor N-terminal domain-containing protein n=1 Tax=Methylobacterium phyllosphaerae TaxID=418223 RepID=UPI003AADD58E
MRPVVEGMGLNWAGQQQKLSADPGRFNCMDIHTLGADGRQREMACIPLRRYPMWLATINPAKVLDPAVRQRVEQLEAERRRQRGPRPAPHERRQAPRSAHAARG